MSRLPMARQVLTATARFLNCFCTSEAEACETNVTEVDAVAPPNDPNIGRYRTGCGVGIDALASPITLHAMNPPLTIISGFTPNIDGFHSTRSASLPGSIDPIALATPCVIAGLIVYFA